LKCIDSTLPTLVDHQRILSQARVEPRFQVYQSASIPVLVAHWAWLNQQIDLVCDKYDNDTALQIIYGLGEYTNVSVSEYTCEYTWQENGPLGKVAYRTHALADELPIIVWSIGARYMIEGVKHLMGDSEYVETGVSAAATKFAEAVKYFELHTTLGKKAGFQGYYQPEPPPHFARAYMGCAFSFLCKGLHQMCYGEVKRLSEKFDKSIVYHMHYYHLYIDKAVSLLESKHTRDGASGVIQSHIKDVQLKAALSWYDFYLAVRLYIDDKPSESWALDEMNAAIGTMEESTSYNYMRALRDELEIGAQTMAASAASGLLMRNIRYVVNTKIINRKKIPHKTFDDEPTYQLFQN
jgi:hypothetical protein